MTWALELRHLAPDIDLEASNIFTEKQGSCRGHSHVVGSSQWLHVVSRSNRALAIDFNVLLGDVDVVNWCQ